MLFYNVILYIWYTCLTSNIGDFNWCGPDKNVKRYQYIIDMIMTIIKSQ